MPKRHMKYKKRKRQPEPPKSNRWLWVLAGIAAFILYGMYAGNQITFPS